MGPGLMACPQPGGSFFSWLLNIAAVRWHLMELSSRKQASGLMDVRTEEEEEEDRRRLKSPSGEKGMGERRGREQKGGRCGPSKQTRDGTSSRPR